MGAIPSRSNHLSTLAENKNALELEILNDQGEAASNMAQAKEAANNRMRAFAVQLASNAEHWLLSEKQNKVLLTEQNAEIERVRALSDDEWKQEQAALRILGSEDILRALAQDE